jgi:hypothetical protein
MVEFVIILIFIMAMCCGMLASTRLLTFQFWAQQEARYIAFEQTWAPHDFYADPENDPIGKLDDGDYFGRPKIVSDRTKSKSVTDDQGLPALLSWLAPAAREESGLHRAIEELDSGPVMVAKNDSFWTKKTPDWLKPGGMLDRVSTVVEDAFASQDVTRSVRSEGFSPNDTPENPRDYPQGESFPEILAPKIYTFLHQAGVGAAVCGELMAFSRRHGNPPALLAVTGDDCPQKIEDGLSSNIAENTDIKDFFRGYEDNMRSGFGPGPALETSVREEVATQFYSLFDTLVSTARVGAVPAIIAGRGVTDAALIDASVGRLVTDARYIGSSAAIAAIIAAVADITVSDPTSQSSSAAKSIEDTIVNILHTDADVAFGTPFFLSPAYLPVPPTFGATAGGLQDAIMKNLLSQSEDSSLRGPQIDNANKMVEVTYNAQGGLFGLAVSKIRNIENAKLTGRFYLVTQPWHLTRREDGTGAYRSKGTQFDTKSDESEEAVLRRRVLGLWLFPSDPAALVEPISLLPGLGFLAPVFDAFEPIGSVISTIKGFVTDNPLFDIAQALSEIPVIGSLVPVPPVWPAVRPDAYPGSVEMTENDPSKPDKLMHNETRNFSDYVNEQRNNNPAPNPTFN